MKPEKKIILFGAGQFGRKAVQYFGTENIAYFVDNNQKLVGSLIEEIPVISFHDLKKIHEKFQIILSVDVGTSFVLSAQLEDAGIHDYMNFLEFIKQDTVNAISPENRESIIHMENKYYSGKRVLMVAYQFPPLSGSGVFRSLKFAKYLPEFGWKPTVISTNRPRPGWNYADESLVKEIPNNMDVIRIPDKVNSLYKNVLSDYEDILLPFLRDNFHGNEEAEDLIFTLEKTKIGRAELINFPCTCLTWAYDVIQYIKNNMDIRQFHAIYTSSDPYSAHLVGAFFKREYGIPWVADYRDLWTGDPTRKMDYKKPKDKLFFYLEDAMLHQADKSITVEEHLLSDYVERFHISKENVAAITNGYDESDFSGLSTKNKHSDKFIINYSGLLHVDRNIDAVLLALRQLCDEGNMEPSCVKFCIVGDARQYNPYQEAEKYKLGSIIEQIRFSSHHEAILSNIRANILLLLVGDEDRVKFSYTGKIFDYLRSGRPILALAPTNGVVAQTLQETGHGEACLSTDLPGIKAFILQEYRKWQRGDKRELLHSPLIKRFERKNLTGQLANIFDEVCC